MFFLFVLLLQMSSIHLTMLMDVTNTGKWGTGNWRTGNWNGERESGN